MLDFLTTFYFKIFSLLILVFYQNTYICPEIFYYFNYEAQGDNFVSHLGFFYLSIIIFWFFARRNETQIIKIVSYFLSIEIFRFCLYVYLNFENLSLSYIFLYKIYNFSGLAFNIEYSLGIDAISFIFLILTAILFPLCYMISWNSIYYNTNIII